MSIDRGALVDECEITAKTTGQDSAFLLNVVVSREGKKLTAAEARIRVLNAATEVMADAMICEDIVGLVYITHQIEGLARVLNGMGDKWAERLTAEEFAATLEVLK